MNTACVWILAWGMSMAGGSEPPNFAAPIVGESYKDIYPVRLVDLNGDGKLDLVHRSQAELHVREGDGFGGFSLSRVLPSVMGRHLIVADVNGDGDVDLIGTYNDGSLLWVRLNDGSGGFGPMTTFAVGLKGDNDLQAGDFNRDGVMDLSMHDVTSVCVLLGDGHGGFALSSTIAVPGGKLLINMALGDLNGDGLLDVAVPSDGQVAVLHGDGVGGLAVGELLPADLKMQSVAAGDLDGDHDDDLITSGSFGLKVRPQSGGALGPLQSIAPVSLRVMSLVDMDGSGLPEIAGIAGFDFCVVRDPGGMAEPPMLRSVGGWPYSFAVARVDGDADLDVVVATDLDLWHGVSLLRGDPAEILDGSPLQEMGDDLILGGVTDLDGDGDLDVVTLKPEVQALQTWRNDGQGGFLPVGAIPISHHAGMVKSADLDGDGRLDVVVAPPPTSAVMPQVTILRGTPGGSFTAVAILAPPLLPKDIAFGRFNADAALDLAMVGLGAGGVNVVLALSQGAGYTTAPLSLPATAERSIAALDADGDGLDDLATVFSNPASVTVHRNLGNGAFAVLQTLPVGEIDQVIALDADGDAFRDLAMNLPKPGNGTRILRGSGAGKFTLGPVQVDNDAADEDVQAHDVDGDGRDDVVLLAKGSFGLLTWLRSVGDGNLEPPRHHGIRGLTTGLAFADVTGDGGPDFVTTYGWGIDSTSDFGGIDVTRRLCRGVTGVFGLGCPLPSGSTPRLHVSGCPEIGRTLQIGVEDAAGAMLGLLVLGLDQAPLPQSAACAVLVTPLLPAMVPFGVGPAGGASIFATVPPTASTSGGFTVQAFVAGPDLAASNGIEVRVR